MVLKHLKQHYYIHYIYSHQGYFESLKAEQPNIEVTLFCPGPTTTEFLEQAFTDKPGQKYGQTAASSAKRLTADRCGYLMATALANKCFISFAGTFPVGLLLNIMLYYPNLRRM